MVPIAQLLEGVAAQYAIAASSAEPLHQFAYDWRGIFRLDDVDGRAWVLRAICHDEAREWLARPVAALQWLKQQAYLAPEVLPTRDGELVGEWSGWSLLVTAFLPGEPVSPLPEHLQLTADALGCLHSVPLPPAESGKPLAISRLHPTRALPPALPLPGTVDGRLPPSVSAVYGELYATLLRVRAAVDLPLSIVHGDAWYANALLTAPDRVAFVDWDNAGEGASVLDLGYLLLTSHYNIDQPTTVRPDAAIIRAILDGYGRHRALTAAEQDLLPDAIRFPLAMHGAAHLAQNGADETDLGVQKLLARYAATAEIARIAGACLDRGP